MTKHDYTDLLTCPYCDHGHEATDLLDSRSSPVRTYQFDCESCEKEFHWTFDVSVTFSSFESDAEKDAIERERPAYNVVHNKLPRTEEQVS